MCFYSEYLLDFFQVGNHVDISTGVWTAVDSGIGAGVDSYYEYLVKGGILLGKKRLLDMFRGTVAILT